MSEHEITTVNSNDGTDLSTYVWEAVSPTGERPRGVVQIAHGMGEHALRYADVAAALNEAGWTVVAHDHRGHGASRMGASRMGASRMGATADAEDELGQIGSHGWTRLVDDIGIVGAFARQQADGAHVLLAHSMGSFAAQQYLLDHSDAVDAVVLTGTGLLDLLEPALDLDQELELEMFNAAFQPARTDFDWLSRDEDQVDRYLADDRCGFGLDTDAAKAMFAGSHDLADAERVAVMRDDLPILIAVGEADPVGGGELALVRPLVQRYRDAGLTDVTLVSYPGARHEILNETNRHEIVAEILRWLDERTRRSAAAG